VSVSFFMIEPELPSVVMVNFRRLTNLF